MDKGQKHRINAARVAVENQVPFFRKQLGQVQSEWKADNTRVTFADFAISENLFKELRATFPEDDYCSEETNPLDEIRPLEARFAWVLDPIDGTNNYAVGMPFCGISLALLRDGLPVYGVIYDRARDKVVHGGPGMGLFDGRQRATPKEGDLGRCAVFGIHFPLPTEVCRQLEPVLTSHRLRALGSGTLNAVYVAIGLYDGCIDYRVKVWDIAAAVALMEAVGVRYCFIDESPFPLKTFHPESPNVPFFAGSEDFCRYFSGILAQG